MIPVLMIRYSFSLIFLAASLAQAVPLEIRFTELPGGNAAAGSSAFFSEAAKFPSSNWESQAQPLGNGRLGVMVFGNPLKERIQFNESSLWTGGANPSGGYGDEEFGAYQNFGDLYLDMDMNGGPGGSDPVCKSGQQGSSGQGVAAAGDGNPESKWCVEHHEKDVIWQVDLGKSCKVSGYGFTSANDVPERDPRTWRFEGSDNGEKWVSLDQHADDAPFPTRGESKDYPLKEGKKQPFRYYRFVFSPAKDATHFQVAEISLAGIPVENGPDKRITHYSRSLDLATAIHRTSWSLGGVNYSREVFVSKPDEVAAIHITADQPGKITGKVRLAGAHGEVSKAEGGRLGFAGSLSNGLRHAAGVSIRCEGGSVKADGESVVVSNADSATLILAAATDYALDPGKGFRSGLNPVDTVAGQYSVSKSVSVIRQAHLGDFQKLMGRVDLDLGGTSENRSITSRLDAYKAGAVDAPLEALMFQYGRYLLISSSRGFLPANLQGLWNDSNQPAWHCDYHTNINLQMNYWLAEPANLSECAVPLFDWTVAMIPGSRAATVKAFGKETPGWTMRTSVNIFGGNGWDWNLPASAWLARHFWDHYAFTGDKEFLAKTAWPVLHDVSDYWLGHLVEKDGKLLVPMGWSPEHGPREDGVAHDQQLVWDLFNNTLDAAKALGTQDDFTRNVATARGKLLGPQVGSWGQIMEWTAERPELEKSHHRHTSHLLAVYPGREITLDGTPELAKAAAISLEARGSDGDSRRSWTWPWRTALWARLGRADKAGEMIRGLLTHNTLPNLFTTHPPFQIDGNLGITAGICETLVQSHAGAISILPALPPAWKDGSFRGLKAAGGFEISVSWKDHSPVSIKVRSVLGKSAVIRVVGDPKAVMVREEGGRRARITAGTDGAFHFPTKAGMVYSLSLEQP